MKKSRRGTTIKKRHIILSSLIFLLICTIFSINPARANPAFENFLNDYTEVDPNNRLTQTATRATFTQETRDETAYVYKDFGAEHFDDWIHDMQFNITGESDSGSGLQGISGGLTYTDDLNHLGWIHSNNKDYILFRLDVDNNQANNRISLYVRDTTVFFSDVSGWVLVPNTLYYVRFNKTDTEVQGGVYSTSILRDAGDGTDGDILNVAVTINNDIKFKYLGTSWSWDDNQPNLWISGYVENLDIHAPVPPPFCELTFTSTYSNGTTSTCCKIYINCTFIPSGTVWNSTTYANNTLLILMIVVNASCACGFDYWDNSTDNIYENPYSFTWVQTSNFTINALCCQCGEGDCPDCPEMPPYYYAFLVIGIIGISLFIMEEEKKRKKPKTYT